MLKQILVPIDETSSLKAVDRAIEMARAERAHVTVLALEGVITTGVVPLSVPDGSTQRRRRELAAIAREARSRAERSGAELDFVVEAGRPTGRIVDEAWSRGADVVVVDETLPWLHGLARLGGARRLRRGAHCPVVFVA